MLLFCKTKNTIISYNMLSCYPVLSLSCFKTFLISDWKVANKLSCYKSNPNALNFVAFRIQL